MRSLGSLWDWDPGFSTPFLFLKLFKLSLTPPKIPAREKLGTTNWRFLFGCGNRVRRMQVCLKNSPHRERADCSFHGCREAAPKLQELQISAPDENGQETMGRGRPKQSRKR